MGRSLLIAELTPLQANLEQGEGRKVAVATTHLESLNSAPVRKQQLKIAQEALQGYSQAILCGDFNFDSNQNWGDWRRAAAHPPQSLENDVLKYILGEEYVDAWPALRPGEAGLTFDGGINPHVSDGQECMRYDRVMVRGMTPESIDLLGAAACVKNKEATETDVAQVYAETKAELATRRIPLAMRMLRSRCRAPRLIRFRSLASMIVTRP